MGTTALGIIPSFSRTARLRWPGIGLPEGYFFVDPDFPDFFSYSASVQYLTETLARNSCLCLPLSISSRS